MSLLPPHYFHPTPGNVLVCAKCGEPPHGLVGTIGSGRVLPPAPRYLTVPIEVETMEQKVQLEAFMRLLAAAAADGGRKRAMGVKPAWWLATDHEPAIFSHLNRWKHGEQHDPDSRAHPLVHLAWRALAIAYQEAMGQTEPKGSV